MPASLSVCLIVRDEADCLATCLESVRPLADEIIVLDTGSTDDTPAIAARCGARVLHYAWHDDFAAARNASLAAAGCDWILVIDADERLAPESLPALKAFLTEPEQACVKLRIHSPYHNGRSDQPQAGAQAGLGAGQYNYTLVRLFPNLPSLRFVRPFHEYLKDFGEPPLPVRLMPWLRLEHSGYDGARPLLKDKAGRNRALIDGLRRTDPENPLWLYYSANAWATAAAARQGPQAERALAEYRELLEQGARQQRLGDDFYYPNGLIEAMSLCRSLALPVLGLELAERFGRLCTAHPDYWYVLGTLRRRLRDEAGAIGCFEACLALRDSEPDFDFCYSPACLDRAPLLQLLQLQRMAHLNPGRTPELRAQALEAWLATCRRAFEILPQASSDWLPHLLEALILARQAGQRPQLRDFIPAQDRDRPLIRAAELLDRRIMELLDHSVQPDWQKHSDWLRSSPWERLEAFADQIVTAVAPAQALSRRASEFSRAAEFSMPHSEAQSEPLSGGLSGGLSGADSLALAPAASDESAVSGDEARAELHSLLRSLAARAAFAVSRDPGWMLSLTDWLTREGRPGLARQALLEALMLQPASLALNQALIDCQN